MVANTHKSVCFCFVWLLLLANRLEQVPTVAPENLMVIFESPSEDSGIGLVFDSVTGLTEITFDPPLGPVNGTELLQVEISMLDSDSSDGPSPCLLPVSAQNAQVRSFIVFLSPREINNEKPSEVTNV